MAGAERLTDALKKRLQPIKAILFDVEGTLIDSSSLQFTQGRNTKALSAEDLGALKAAVARGFVLGIITSRVGKSVDEIAEAAGISDVYQGYLNKSSAYEEFKRSYEFEDEEIAYMGDDILDLSVIKMAGFGAAPYDAHSSVRFAAHFVCRAKGGNGAASELLELLFAANGSTETPPSTLP